MSDPSFSPEVFNLVTHLESAKTKEDRERLMLAIAEEASKTYDPTDAENCDDYHVFFEEYQEAEKRYKLAAFRLGRLVSQSAETIDKLTDPRTSTKSTTSN